MTVLRYCLYSFFPIWLEVLVFLKTEIKPIMHWSKSERRGISQSEWRITNVISEQSFLCSFTWNKWFYVICIERIEMTVNTLTSWLYFSWSNWWRIHYIHNSRKFEVSIYSFCDFQFKTKFYFIETCLGLQFIKLLFKKKNPLSTQNIMHGYL